MKRVIAVTFLLVLVLPLAFSGGSQEGIGTAQLRYLMWDPQIIDKEQALADKFHAQNPGISIKVGLLGQGQVHPSLSLCLQQRPAHGPDRCQFRQVPAGRGQGAAGDQVPGRPDPGG